jgi:hypothetical protein
MSWTGFEVWLNATPPVFIGLVLFVVVIVALLLGHAAGARLRRPLEDGAETFVVSSVFGLLALLLGFTFALAIDRYETRRILVQEEANAVNTAFTRAQLLDEPYRSQISDLLVQYTNNRIALAQQPPGANRELLERNDRLVREFWAASAGAFPTIRQLDFSSTFIEGVNDVLNIEATRKSARVARLPTEVFALLMIYVVVSAAVLGAEVRGKRELVLSALLLALLTMSLMLIVDIDRPVLGGVREAQGPMERLLVTLTAAQSR